MNTVYLIFIILIGLCIGSFINVCIYRIPQGKSIAFPPSGCTSCGTRIRAMDLIPVISYLILGGKCRNCKEKISIRYPLIELLTGVLFAVVFLKFGLTLQFAIYAAIVSVMVMIFFIDLKHMIIPDGLNVVCAILGIGLNIAIYNGDLKSTLLNLLFGFLLGGGIFFLLALLGAMGGGDIKLMAALGLAFGWKLTILLMFLSFVLGGIVGVILLATKIKTMKDMIPFGPYITIATVIVIFYGNQILNWYLSMFTI